MASIKFRGLKEIEIAYMSQAEGTAEKVERMLVSGAQINTQAQKKSIEQHNLIDTKSMMNSVRPTKVKKSAIGAVIYVYPQGKDNKGVKNAAKAFIKEYGTSKTPGTRWMTAANESSAGKILDEQFKIWAEGLDGSS